MARCFFYNQVSIIKSISDSLPEGWKIYVKEHPHQFNNLNTKSRWFYLAGIKKFRSKEFYQEIKAIPNVKLVGLTVKSSQLIKNAAVVSTINGTAILEAIALKKIVFSFSQETTPFAMLDDVFDIKKTSDIAIAFNKIIKGFVPRYTKLKDFFDTYVFEIDSNNPKKLNNVMRAIQST